MQKNYEEILRTKELLAEGKSIMEIANELGKSFKQIQRYISYIQAGDKVLDIIDRER